MVGLYVVHCHAWDYNSNSDSASPSTAVVQTGLQITNVCLLLRQPTPIMLCARSSEFNNAAQCNAVRRLSIVALLP